MHAQAKGSMLAKKRGVESGVRSTLSRRMLRRHWNNVNSCSCSPAGSYRTFHGDEARRRGAVSCITEEVRSSRKLFWRLKVAV
mmetsp:Transcript_16241/g.46808  ORF Transcript_16241/g.46808 Transcript_16241/m.46808 type:complete len:83 (-) Transcript_16241:556-804(-)